MPRYGQRQYWNLVYITAYAFAFAFLPADDLCFDVIIVCFAWYSYTLFFCKYKTIDDTICLDIAACFRYHRGDLLKTCPRSISDKVCI